MTDAFGYGSPEALFHVRCLALSVLLCSLEEMSSLCGLEPGLTLVGRVFELTLPSLSAWLACFLGLRFFGQVFELPLMQAIIFPECCCVFSVAGVCSWVSSLFVVAWTWFSSLNSCLVCDTVMFLALARVTLLVFLESVGTFLRHAAVGRELLQFDGDSLQRLLGNRCRRPRMILRLWSVLGLVTSCFQVAFDFFQKSAHMFGGLREGCVGGVRGGYPP